MRERLLLISLVALAGAAALKTVTELAWAGCVAADCRGPPAWFSWVDTASLVLVAASAAAFLWGLFPMRPPSRFRVGIAAAFALTLALLSFLVVSIHRGSCQGMGGGAMVCTENYPGWVVMVLAYVATWCVLFAIAAGVHALLSFPRGSAARMRGLRVALIALALCFLLPAVLGALNWWNRIPSDAALVVRDGQLCGEWSRGLGSGTTCIALSGLVTLPLFVLAGVGAAAQAGRPSWRWVGWGAVLLGALSVLTIVAFNVGRSARSDWLGTAALTAGLAATCWLLAREQRNASPIL